MPESVSAFEMQAEYFANIPILDKTYRASVHLENEKDEMFWDTMLQECRPGKYNYIYFSKSELGNDSKGCKQCLKYKNHLSRNFFICIDSDLRHLSRKQGIDSAHFILQTYSYSWENHYCYAEKLEKSWKSKCPEKAQGFSFLYFINEFSCATYTSFLHLLTMRKRGFKEDFSLRRFDEPIPRQCNNKELAENGKGILRKIKTDNFPYVNVQDKVYFQQLGLNEKNTYLHIKGHTIYTLIKSIGDYFCHRSNINFEKDVILEGLQTIGYWEIDKIREDITAMLGD